MCCDSRTHPARGWRYLGNIRIADRRVRAAIPVKGVSAVKVSVVIPTTLRDSLAAAVRSVRAQRGETELEVIVVVDRSPGTKVDHEVEQSADRLLWSNSIGGAGARNIGIKASSGDLIAFLDDDDEWLPSKIQQQLELASRYRSEVVLASRFIQGQKATNSLSGPLPESIWSSGQGPIEDYLFLRRKPSLGRATIYTSTIMVSASLAKRVPWTTGLRRHQDWDWLMRLTRQPNVYFEFAPEPGAVIWMNTAGSISASKDWQCSLEWVDGWRDELSPKVFVDFIAAQPLRYALQAKSRSGVAECLQRIRNASALPSAGPVLIGLAGLVPRERLVGVLARSKTETPR